MWTTKDLFLQRILPNLCYHCVLQQVYFAWNCREVVHTPRVWSSSHSSFAKIIWWWRWGRAMVLLSERFQWMTWHLNESSFKCQVYSSAPLTQKYCLLGCFIPCRSANGLSNHEFCREICISCLLYVKILWSFDRLFPQKLKKSFLVHGAPQNCVLTTSLNTRISEDLE